MVDTSRFILRQYCSTCGDEFARHIDLSQSEQTHVVLGNCQTCFNKQELVLLECHLLEGKIGRFDWHRLIVSKERVGTTRRYQNFHNTAVGVTAEKLTRASIDYYNRLREKYKQQLLSKKD